LRSILSLLDIVELVSKALQVLGLNHSIDVIRAESLFAEAMLVWDLIIDEARVDLFNSRLVLETLPVLLNVLWSAWTVGLEDVRLQAELAALIGPKCNDLSGCPCSGVALKAGG